MFKVKKILLWLDFINNSVGVKNKDRVGNLMKSLVKLLFNSLKIGLIKSLVTKVMSILMKG